MNEEEVLKSRIKDLANKSYKQNIYTYSGFLTPAELGLVDEYCDEHLCEVGEIVRILKDRVPIEAVYEQHPNGKPYWQQEFLQNLSFVKKFPCFSISHSGEYAALVIADEEIGLDIQEERPTRFKGGCQAFSRMEAYVKCTGEGYAKGYAKYNELNGEMPNYEFYKINVLSDYVIYLCYEKL